MSTPTKLVSGKNKEVIVVTVAVDEAVERETYTLDNVATTLLAYPALLKIRSSVTTGDIKITLAGTEKTVLTMSYADVNEANIHVLKVWDTGTDLTTSQFYLWQ